MIKEILGESFNVISHTAPLLASALGSPAAGLAAKFAVSLLGHAFNVSSGEPEDIKKAMDDLSTHEPNMLNGILRDLESKFGLLLNNMTAIKMPSNVEVNIKCVWAN